VAKLRQLLSVRDFWLVVLGSLAILVATYWLAFQFVQPMPPKRIVMTTGPEGGAYRKFAERYRDALAHDGIEVELRPSAGSVENLRRLRDESSGVSVGFVQGGVGVPEENDDLVSLASLYYEPLWVFYRKALAAHDTIDLPGKRIAIGPEGSGTRSLALRLLNLFRVTARNASLLDLDTPQATDALVRGSIDVAVFVADPASPFVSRLVHDENIRIRVFSRAEAITRLLPFLSRVVLPQGILDLHADVPHQDVELVAPTANLVVRGDLHPALIMLLVQAATDIHGGAGLLHRPGDFPSTKGVDFPLSPEAARFFKSGPPFLHRHLPFWLAVLIDRSIVLLVPLLAVLIPVFKLAPAIYTWRIRSRIYRWYGELKKLEADMRSEKLSSDFEGLRERLERIENEVSRMPTPLAFAEYSYNLRAHVDLVRWKLDKRGRKPV
jgi:TRAP transporter TAXI family solute receptor